MLALTKIWQEVPKEDFDEWIRNGKILCKVFNALVFNSVPFDMVDSRDIEVVTFGSPTRYNFKMSTFCPPRPPRAGIIVSQKSIILGQNRKTYYNNYEQ
jgi:hypothetical protein